MADRQILQSLHSSLAVAPSAETLYEGELAICMNPSLPRIWHKLDDNSLAEYTPKSYNDETYSTKAYVDAKVAASINTYSLVFDEETGNLRCLRNGTSDSFQFDESTGNISIL